MFVQKNLVDPEQKVEEEARSQLLLRLTLYPVQKKRPQAAESVHESEPPDMYEAEGIPAAEEIGEGARVNQACASCDVLRNEKRKLSNTVKSLRKKLIEKRKELTKMEKKLEGKSFSEAGYVIIYLKNIRSHHACYFRGKYDKWTRVIIFCAVFSTKLSLSETLFLNFICMSLK